MSFHSNCSIFVHLRCKLQPKQDPKIKEGMSYLRFPHLSEKITLSRERFLFGETNTGQVKSCVADFITSKVFHVKRPPEIIFGDVAPLIWGFLRIFMHVDIKKTWFLLKVTTCCRSNSLRFQHCLLLPSCQKGNNLLNMKLGICPKIVIKGQ